MEILMIAALIGFATSFVCWVTMRRHMETALLKSRTSSMVGAIQLPYPIGGSAADLGGGAGWVTLEDARKDKIARDLFVAGLRDRRTVRLFHLLNHLSWFLPVTLMVGAVLMRLPTLMDIGLWCAAGLFAFGALRLTLRSLKAKRQKRILKIMPQLLDLMIVCIEGGLNFTAALPRVLREMDSKEPLVREFALMHHEFMGGIPLREAMDRLAARCEVPDLAVVLNAITQSEQMGTSLGQTLRIQAAQLRDKKRQRMREEAQKIPVKIIFPAMLILSTLFIVVLAPSVYQIVTHLRQVGVVK